MTHPRTSKRISLIKGGTSGTLLTRTYPNRALSRPLRATKHKSRVQLKCSKSHHGTLNLMGRAKLLVSRIRITCCRQCPFSNRFRIRPLSKCNNKCLNSSSRLKDLPHSSMRLRTTTWMTHSMRLYRSKSFSLIWSSNRINLLRPTTIKTSHPTSSSSNWQTQYPTKPIIMLNPIPNSSWIWTKWSSKWLKLFVRILSRAVSRSHTCSKSSS